MSLLRQFFVVCPAPLLFGATKSKPDQRHPFGSPEHQEKVKQPMHYVKRSMQICILALVLTALLTTGVAQAARLTGGRWSIVPSPDGGTNGNSLQGVAAISATDIWAVGDYANSNNKALIEHWNGTSWQIVPSPNGGSYLYGVAQVPGGTSLWAVGTNGGHTLTEFSG